MEYEAEFIRPLDRALVSGSWDFLPAEPSAHLLSSTHPWHPRSAQRSGATYDVKIRVPSPFIAAASGTTVKRWDDEPGYAGLHTRLGEPARRFAVVFGSYQMLSGKLYGAEEDQAENFDYERKEEGEEEISVEEYAEKWGNPTIYVYALERQRKRLPDMLDKTRNILHAYNEFFQTPIRFDELDVVQMSFFAGFGQAPPGLVQLTGEAFLRPAEFSNVEGGEPEFLDGFLAHELGHAWWPHITGMRNDEQDAWLSEAFAEYTAGLYLELFKEDEEGTGFKALSEQAEKEWLMGRGYFGQGILDVEPYKQGSLYSPGASRKAQVYRKGPYVLHMLRNVLGPGLFQALLQRFLKDFAGKQPVTPDFIDTVRKLIGGHVTGDTFKAYMESKKPITEWPKAHRDEFLRLRDFYKNLDAWFEDWYVDPGHAKIRFSWSAQKDAGSYVFTGRIRQDPEEFKMVLAPIILRFKKDATFARRFVDKPDYEFQLRFPREPTEVVFDEFKTLAAEVTVEAAQP